MSPPNPASNRRFEIVLLTANMLVLAFVIYLLFANFVSQKTLERSTDNHLVLLAEKQADSIGYFLSERHRDLKRLALSSEMMTYFQNKALGMSMQYGLRASLRQLADSTGLIKSERSTTGNTLFSSLQLVEADGTLLIENDTIVENRNRKKVVLTNTSIWGKSGSIHFSVPVIFKNQAAGYLLGDVPAELLLTWRNRDTSSGNSMCLLGESGRIFGFLPNGIKPDLAVTQDLYYFKNNLVTVCAIPGTPFRLLISAPASAEPRNWSLWKSILGIGAPLLFILVGFYRRLQLKEAENELHKSRDQFQSLVANIPGVTYRCKYDKSWTMIYISPNIEVMSGFCANDFIDNKVRSFESLIHQDDISLVSEKISEAINKGESWQIEYRIIHKDNSIHWVDERGKALTETQGKIDCLDGFILDITARKMAETELVSLARLQEMLTEISSTYISLPLNTVSMAIEESLGKLGALVKADRVYLFDYDFEHGLCNNTHEWCADGVEPLRKELKQVPNSMLKELVEKHQNGEAMHIPDILALSPESGIRQLLEPQGIKSLIAVPLIDGQKCLGFAGFDSVKRRHYYSDAEQRLLTVLTHMLVNVRKRQETEAALHQSRLEAEKANHAKSEFLANMSHEIRTPLNAIIGFAQILECDNSIGPAQSLQINTIARSGNHLLTLINDILDMAKIEAGKIAIRSEDFCIHELLDDLALMFRSRSEAKGVKLIIERNESVPRYVNTDEAKLRQVIVNLLGNAVKFTQAGKVVMRINFFKKLPDSTAESTTDRLMIEVEDTGPGILLSDAEHLFDSFKQSEAGRQAGGTGLGLAISRNLVELLGGKISFETVYGKGSCFRFYLPIAECQTNPERAKLETRRVIGLQAGSPSFRILVVDDQKDNRDLLIALLEPVGLAVKVATNGLEAIEVFEQWAPHALLMDIRMPVMDGYEAARRIKLAPGGHNIPIIAITASAFDVDEKEILRSGMDAYVRKPFRSEDLFTVLGKMLSLSYIYAEDSADKAKDPVTKPLTREALRSLPPEHIREMRMAIENGNMEKLYELIGMIEKVDIEIAGGLQTLAKNYEYEQLNYLLDQ